MVIFLLASGCSQREEIASYDVLKPELVDPTLVSRPVASTSASKEQQTIGLIVLADNVGWFFKLTGERAAVEPQHENFVKFVQTIEFSAGAEPKPKWTLPEGWRELPGREMRFATIQVEAEGRPLELSVIPLPKPSGDDRKYVLDNVNRWRQQLQLPAVDASELESTTKTLTVGGREATLVSLVGTGSGSMGGAPFAPFAGGALPPDHPPIGAGDKTTGAAKKSP